VPVKPLPYASLEALLAGEPACPEDPGTEALIRRLRGVRRRGEFTRAEFLLMCRWKSPRAALHYRRNSAARIRQVSRAVLSTRDERRRLDGLLSLSGVSVPVASAILTLIDPRRYGVLDIRVWQLLHALGGVRTRPSGRGFGARHWDEFLTCLRPAARRLGVSVRAVEYTLFHCHRRFQAGRLYDRLPRGRSAARTRPDRRPWLEVDSGPPRAFTSS
jgi:hypothetical protein